MRTLTASNVIAALLCACSANHVQPMSRSPGERLCIIENPRVRPEFLQEYRDALRARGIESEVLAPTAGIAACPLTSRYLAAWTHGTLTSAHLDVFRDGQPAGRAVYQNRWSLSGYSRGLLNEMVDQIFAK